MGRHVVSFGRGAGPPAAISPAAANVHLAVSGAPQAQARHLTAISAQSVQQQAQSWLGLDHARLVPV